MPYTHEILLVENFINKNRRDRYLKLMQTKKGRIKFRKYIPHFKDLIIENTLNVNYLEKADKLIELLLVKQAPKDCYIISENSNYDKCSMELKEAVRALFNSGISFFLSCIPGKLAYYEGEDINSKLLLMK